MAVDRLESNSEPATDDGTGATDARRSVVPAAAGRSLWLAAAWTGAGAAVFCSVAAIVAVAICWLPASGGSGNAGSAIRAGVLVFLASLHAGITVDGVPTAFVPLGMTVIVGLVAWRAGSGLADAVDDLGEERPGRLARVCAAQVAVFALVCGAGALLVSLGTSSVAPIAATFTGAVLFALTGGVAFARWSALGDAILDRLPELPVAVFARAARAAVVGVACYLGVGALLVAASLVVHHERVEALSAQVGGGWAGAPVLLLGILAAPNAVIAASAYLAGPGFALGTDTHVSLFTTAHGVLPAFPVLGAMPVGHGAPWPMLALAAATPVLAGATLAAYTMRTPGWLARLGEVGVAAMVAGAIGMVLAWQGGGAIGSGRLNALGASPWQFGAALCVQVAVLGSLGLAGAALGGLVRRWWSDRRVDLGDDATDSDSDSDRRHRQRQRQRRARPAADRPATRPLGRHAGRRDRGPASRRSGGRGAGRRGGQTPRGRSGRGDGQDRAG